jgi:hypothetical protein
MTIVANETKPVVLIDIFLIILPADLRLFRRKIQQMLVRNRQDLLIKEPKRAKCAGVVLSAFAGLARSWTEIIGRRRFKAEPASGCDSPRKDRGDRILSLTGARAEGRLQQAIGDQLVVLVVAKRKAPGQFLEHGDIRLASDFQRGDLIGPTEHLGRARRRHWHGLIEQRTISQNNFQKHGCSKKHL